VSTNVSQSLHDHLTVIIAECDLLEDTFGARSDVMTPINIIRNAAHRVANAVEDESRPPFERFAATSSGSCVQRAGE